MMKRSMLWFGCSLLMVSLTMVLHAAGDDQKPEASPGSESKPAKTSGKKPTGKKATAQKKTGAEKTAAEKTAPQDKAAVDRARKTVKMLDDIYKTTVVLITDKYVNDEKDFPAGSAAVALFREIDKKGWLGTRLIDVSGEPYEEKNVANDAFEKKGVAALKEGKPYYEEIVEKEGKPYLRAMTPVPVVMKKCIMCHPNYADAKPGAAIGAISYTLPIE